MQIVMQLVLGTLELLFRFGVVLLRTPREYQAECRNEEKWFVHVSGTLALDGLFRKR
jgi:hypothetical protein